jgi:hypothetical protein
MSFMDMDNQLKGFDDKSSPEIWFWLWLWVRVLIHHETP